MNKRTSRKHKNNHVKRSNKSHRRTISKRKKQSGGGDIRSIILLQWQKYYFQIY